VYLHKKTSDHKFLYPPLQISRTPEIQEAGVEIVDDSLGAFICTLIPVSDICPSDGRTANLEQTIHELHNQLAQSQQTLSMSPTVPMHISLTHTY